MQQFGLMPPCHLGKALCNVLEAAACVEREAKAGVFFEDVELLPLLLRASNGRPGTFVDVGAHFHGYQCEDARLQPVNSAVGDGSTAALLL